MNNLQKRINEMFPNENLEVLEYSIMKNPASVRCLKCNSIYTLKKAENFVRKGKKCICTRCVNNRSGGRLTLKDFQEKLNNKYPNENIKALKYTLKDKPATVKCLKCGNTYTLENAESFFNKDKKRVCSHCFPNKREAMKNTINNFKSFIQESKDFDLITEDLFDVKSHTLIECRCLRCGKINKKTIYDYLRGRRCSCIGNNILISQEDFQKELGEEYTCLSKYKGREHKVLIRHNLCGFIYNGNGRHYYCPKCQGSKGEKTISFLLDSKKVYYEREKTVNIKNHKLRFDFFLPDYNCFIEFNGEQHYKSIPYFGGDEGLKKQQLYDKYKRDYCKDNNINLLIIDYNDDIQSKLFNYLLKFNDYPEREYTQVSGSGNYPIE